MSLLRSLVSRLSLSVLALLAVVGLLPAQPGGDGDWVRVTEDERAIKIETDKLEAVIPKKNPKHWMSGIEKGSFLDKATGFREVGDGLMVVDWLMEPGTDEAYRDRLPGDLPYHFNNLVHGKRPKRSIEGPQICTKAGKLAPRVSAGKDFVAIKSSLEGETLSRQGQAVLDRVAALRVPVVAAIHGSCLGGGLEEGEAGVEEGEGGRGAEEQGAHRAGGVGDDGRDQDEVAPVAAGAGGQRGLDARQVEHDPLPPLA